MYSILKTQKKRIKHKKYSPVTTSTFITNFHILLTFADKSYIIYALRLSTDSNQHQFDQLVAEDHLPEFVTHAKRMNQGAILICKNCSYVYCLSFDNNMQISLEEINRGFIPQMLQSQASQSQNMMNAMGCQIKLHTFENSCFIIQFNLFDDHKIVFDCYQNTNNQPLYYQMTTIEIDLQINGSYITENCNSSQGEIAIYKQQEIDDVNWELKILRNFTDKQEKQLNIILPSDTFTEEISIMQVVAWLSDQYLVITYANDSRQMTTFLMEKMDNLFSFHKFHNFNVFADDINFSSIIHTDLNKEIFYALTQTHQRIDGELYENGLVIGNMKTGSVIEKGYLSYKNIDLSPDSRYILDVPNQFESYGQIFYHIRLLLSKSSLYMFMMENTFMSEISASLKQTIVKML